jgi:putative nucleotidyltransferase with HDIG domain
MAAKRIPVIECSENHLLAEEIRNSQGVLLASQGNKMTVSLKTKLISLGILSVKVYNFTRNSFESKDKVYQEVRTNYTNTLSAYKDFIYGIAAGKKLEYDKVLGISKRIHASINDSRNLIRCLNEIQRADEYTYTHSINTSIYCMLIAKWMGLNDRDIKIAIQSGLMHDIGKVKIPDIILNKVDRLTEEEFAIMKKHTLYGFELLNNIDDIEVEVRQAALMHHERMNGSGYPYNTSADFIGLFAKITAVADVYDAITSERVYCKRRTPFKAFCFLSTSGIGILDTKVLSTFLSNITAYYIGSSVLLDNGETGKVVHIPVQCSHKPIIEVNGEYIDLSEDGSLEIVEILKVE